jgi:hypothetical protein
MTDATIPDNDRTAWSVLCGFLMDKDSRRRAVRKEFLRQEDLMAIFGSPLWNDWERAYFTQENNSIEHLLKCRLPTGFSPLETCGPTASLNCQASLGREVEITTPGGYCPQPEDVLASYFNDPRNFGKLRKAWPGLDPDKLPGNEVPQWYPIAIREVFGNACEFVGDISFGEAVEYIRKGRTLQVCLCRPRHFVSLVAYDDESSEFIIKDSWGGRWPDGDGFCKRLSHPEFETNVRPFCLVYS